MRNGTKSLLFGSNGMLWFPIIAIISWVKLYGFTVTPRVFLNIILYRLKLFGKDYPDIKGDANDKYYVSYLLSKVLTPSFLYLKSELELLMKERNTENPFNYFSFLRKELIDINEYSRNK